MEKQAIELRFNGKRVRLSARIRFKGDHEVVKGDKTIRALVIEELERQFSSENPLFREMIGNEYDFPEQMGQRIKVSSRFEETSEAPYVCFHVIDALGICGVPMFPLWRKSGNKHILLFTGDIRTHKLSEIPKMLLAKEDEAPTKGVYSPQVVARVAAHEFGHALGIGDLYGGWAPYGLCYRYAAAVTPEMPYHDIMRTHFCDQDFFTPNDLEMALLAQKENAPQTHLITGSWLKGLGHVSRAVRLCNVDADAVLQRKQRNKQEKNTSKNARNPQIKPNERA